MSTLLIRSYFVAEMFIEPYWLPDYMWAREDNSV